MKHITNHTLFLLLGFMIAYLGVQGQSQTEEVVVPLSNPGKAGILEVHVHSGKVQVEGGNSTSEVVVEVTTIEGKQKEKKTYPGGLKRIPNTSTNIRITEDDNHIEVSGDHSNRRSDLVIRVPRNFSLEIHTHHNGDIIVSNVKGEMDLNSHHGPITATNIGGAVIANTHHGAIKVDFDQVNSELPMAFSTYHGDVKISLPGNSSFSSKIKSARGEILTDFDMNIQTRREPEKKREEHGHFEVNIGGWVYGETNGGGQEYLFSTYHGDIIIQKK